ncbi:MAG: nucleotide exchange factor GrpE [Nitrospirae bacterium]|nr:nucleotide exchange factor GrpE [Nitrospirota bacterium]
MDNNIDEQHMKDNIKPKEDSVGDKVKEVSEGTTVKVIDVKSVEVTKGATEKVMDDSVLLQCGAETTELDMIKGRMAEINDKYMRLYAEFDNYKKRMQREKEEILKFSMEPLISDLLPVIDNLEAALSHAANSTTTSLSTGVELTLKEFKKAMGRYGLVEIEAKGKAFDPAFHEAMAETESAEVEDRTVLEEFRKGYLFKDRVLRASLVKVSKKIEKAPEKD